MRDGVGKRTAHIHRKLYAECVEVRNVAELKHSHTRFSIPRRMHVRLWPTVVAKQLCSWRNIEQISDVAYNSTDIRF